MLRSFLNRVLLGVLFSGAVACYGVGVPFTSPMQILDSSTRGPLVITARSTPPSSPVAGEVYLDDGTNTVTCGGGSGGFTAFDTTNGNGFSGGNGGSYSASISSNINLLMGCDGEPAGLIIVEEFPY